MKEKSFLKMMMIIIIIWQTISTMFIVYCSNSKEIGIIIGNGIVIILMIKMTLIGIDVKKEYKKMKRDKHINNSKLSKNSKEEKKRKWKKKSTKRKTEAKEQNTA